ncbi:MAG TPA: SDR family oxidoreductase [Thermoanaerobaculia bacterium]|jgi:NAD(P)-dependent dehydrogenase (short-subunit alcohol dehydrogenase family)|nr:SDR family oxidoreductase [Thermoanaerobaculia bacterium]
MMTTQKKTPRIAIVTGGSRGIGHGIATDLLAEGWHVFLCSRSQEFLEEALRDLGGRFGGVVAGRPVDVRRQEEVDAFVAWVFGEAGRIDCLVNNAGLGRFGPVDELTGDQWREVLQTNLDGAFYFIRAVAPVMKRQGDGWIFNIASLAGKNPMAGGAAYNASKFGLIGLSEAAMLDLRQFGVRVSAILPGSVDTGFGRGSGRNERKDRDWMLRPEDIAAMILHLLSYPQHALPSRIEMRPSRPPKS